jgi:lambda family phage portal protein
MKQRFSISQAIGDAIDSAVLMLSPSWGVKRKMARLAASQMAYHDGAEDDRLHGAGRWLGSKISPDSALEDDLETLRERSRELYRSDSIGGLIDSNVDHVIGTGFTMQSRPMTVGGITEERSQQVSDELEQTFNRWASRCDTTLRRNLWQLSRLAYRHLEVDGETFTRKMASGSRSEKPIPLTLQIIDPVRVETPPKESGNPLVRMGVEYNDSGEVVAYHVRKTNPYDTKQISISYDRVPAAEMIHVYEPWFAGQSRGYPAFTRVLNRLKDAKDLDEASLIAAQIEACFSVFVKSAPGGETLGAIERARLAATGQQGGRQLEEIAPGRIQYLNSSEDVVFAQPTRPGNSVGPLQELNHRRIASGMNEPYEMLMKDWRGVSFAGGRIVLNAKRLSVKSKQKLFGDAWFIPIWEEFVRQAVSTGATSLTASEYQRMPWAWNRVDAVPPTWSYSITPSEEVRAKNEKIQTNQTTLQETCAEDGKDWKDVLRQRQRERDMEREFGLLDPDQIMAEKTPVAAETSTNAVNGEAA